MSDKIRDALVEAVAEAIYVQWSTQAGYVPWVARGNSLKQGEARRIARSAIENGFPLAQQPAPAAPVAVQEPVAWMTDESWRRLRAGGNDSRGTVPVRGMKTSVAKIPLYAAPPAAEQPECGCCGQTGPCDPDCDCAEQPHGPDYCDGHEFDGWSERSAGPQNAAIMPCGTAVSNVHEAYEAEMETAEQPDTLRVPMELAETIASFDHTGVIDRATLRVIFIQHYAALGKLRALLAGGDKP